MNKLGRDFRGTSIVSALDRKLFRDLWNSKGMLSTIVAILSIGVACFSAMATLYNNLTHSRESYYASGRMADFWIDLKKAPVSDVESLLQMPGVTEIRPRISFPVRVDLPDEPRTITGLALSVPDQPGSFISGIQIRQGGYFSERKREEVIISDAFAKARSLSAGQTIRLILNNRSQDLEIVGTAICPEFVYSMPPGSMIPDPESFGIFYLKQSFAEEAFDMEGACNQVIGTLSTQYQQQPEAILREMERRLDPFGVVLTTPRDRQSSHVFLTSETRNLRVSVTIVPTIFLTVAAMVLNVQMTRTAEQQRVVVGTLKALGYSDWEILAHFLKFGSLIGLLGGLIGVSTGYGLSGYLTSVYREFYEFPRLDNLVYPNIVSAGVAIGWFFSLAGTLRGVRSVIRLRPAEAMRQSPPVRGGKVFVERWNWLWKQLDFRWHMVVRSVIRNWRRTLVGLTASALGAMVMLVSLHLRDAMNHIIALQYDQILLSDFDLSFRNEREFASVTEVRQMPGVDWVEPVLSVPCTFRNGHYEKRGSITGILPDARLTIPRTKAGDAVHVPPAGAVFTRAMADRLQVVPGDLVTVEPVRGDRRIRQVTVSSIVDSYFGLSVYADFHYLNQIIGEEDAVSYLQVKSNPQPDSVNNFHRQLKELPAIESVASIRDQRDRLVEVLVDKMMISITILISFAGLLFFASILNAALISVSERHTEIATLEVLGYTPQEVSTIFLRESLLVNLPGVLLGLPMGHELAYQLTRMMDTDLFRVPFYLKNVTYFYVMGLGLTFTLLAHLPVRRTIQWMDWKMALNVKQ